MKQETKYPEPWLERPVREISETLGASPRTVFRWRAGDHEPSAVYRRLAEKAFPEARAQED